MPTNILVPLLLYFMQIHKYQSDTFVIFSALCCFFLFKCKGIRGLYCKYRGLQSLLRQSPLMIPFLCTASSNRPHKDP